MTTQTVLQTGAGNSHTGFYLGSFGGNGTDYALDSNGGAITLASEDLNVTDVNTTGTFTTQPIPFDFNLATGVLALGAPFATKKVWQNFQAQKATKPPSNSMPQPPLL